MARLHKPPLRTGTYNGIGTYKMRGEYFIRVKSSLTAKRVKNSPEFAQTRFHAGLLARTSKIGSGLYKGLRPKQKKKFTYQFITGKVMKMLQNGIGEEEIMSSLQKGF